MYYKLACFLCSARIPRTYVDEYFRNSFLSAGSDVSRVTFSYYWAYILYKKINEMVIDSQYKNGFVGFKWAQYTEIWYQHIISVLNYLLRDISFA